MFPEKWLTVPTIFCYDLALVRARPAPDNAISKDAVLNEDTRALYDALSELIRIYQFRDRDRICCYDVSVTQCYALEALVAQSAMTMTSLAAHLYLDKSTTSRVVDALERKGYVKRLSHPEDGRSILLEVTPVGRALHGRIVAGILKEERELLRDFRTEVRHSMIHLLRRLARAAERRVQDGGGTCCP
jgi:DNA-binding MarR family transcriptional regulator